jgi:hypothetical protein
MATCPLCKQKIALRTFLAVIPNWNPKMWITCNHCKRELRPRYWLLCVLAWYASSFVLGAILFSLAEADLAPSLILFVSWVAYVMVSPVFLVFAKFTAGELSDRE